MRHLKGMQPLRSRAKGTLSLCSLSRQSPVWHLGQATQSLPEPVTIERDSITQKNACQRHVGSSSCLDHMGAVLLQHLSGSGRDQHPNCAGVTSIPAYSQNTWDTLSQSTSAPWEGLHLQSEHLGSSCSKHTCCKGKR